MSRTVRFDAMCVGCGFFGASPFWHHGVMRAATAAVLRAVTSRPKMTGFIAANRDALSVISVAFFMMQMFDVADDREAVAECAKHTSKAREKLVAPNDGAFFEGIIDPTRVSFIDRMALWLIKSPVGDRHDWGRIAAWDTTLVSQPGPGPT